MHIYIYEKFSRIRIHDPVVCCAPQGAVMQLDGVLYCCDLLTTIVARALLRYRSGEAGLLLPFHTGQLTVNYTKIILM